MKIERINSNIPALLASWRDASAAFTVAAKQPGAGNFDTHDCIAWQGVQVALCDELRGAVPTTQEDARALLQFALEEDGGADPAATVPRSVIENVMGWLSSGRSAAPN